jgi:hypothetical protein
LKKLEVQIVKISNNLFSVLLILILLIGLRVPAYADDSRPSQWAEESVEVAILFELVPQNLQSQYTQPITRAEFAALAVTLYEFWHGEISGRSHFIDTNDMNVQKAAYIGVVSGVGNNMFSPDAHLTREQAATMLSRLATIMGVTLPSQSPTFADNDTISQWAFASVGQIQYAGIMSGVGNNMFSAQGAYTREQSIVTIVRLMEYILGSVFG